MNCFMHVGLATLIVAGATRADANDLAARTTAMAPTTTLSAKTSNAPLETAAAVLAKVADSTAAIPGFTASLSARAKLRSFPFLGTTFSGTASYAGDRSVQLNLKGLPGPAQGFQKTAEAIADDAAAPAAWAQKYDIAVALGNAGHTTLVLTPKAPGDFATVTLSIDSSTGQVDQATLVPTDGGTIVVSEHYAMVQGHEVIVHQDVSIAVPQAKADVGIDFSNFKFIDALASR
jgi:hypothetical protein